MRYRSSALLIVFGVLLTQSIPVSAQDGVKSCVWKVTGEKTSIYLAGSVHLLRPQDRPFPSSYQVAYEKSDRLWLEVDIDKAQSPETTKLLLRLSMYDGDDTLQNHVSDQTLASLRRFCEQRKLKASAFEKLRPAIAAMTVASFEATRLGAKAEDGVDLVYARKAKEDGKPVLALETAEFQITMFNRLSASDQEGMLRMALKEADETQESMLDLIRAWKQGDVAALEELNRPLNRFPALKRILLDNRNENWMAVIETELDSSGTAMFIVGAGHLIGENSLVSRLQKKGYRVKQL